MLPERLRLAQQYLDDAQYLLAADRLASAEAGVQTVYRTLAEIDQRTQGGHP